jgi:hypothetical protein
MTDGGRMPRLPLEPGEELRVGGILGAEDLDRDLAAQHLVPGPPHRRHAASPQDGYERVTATQHVGVCQRHD